MQYTAQRVTAGGAFQWGALVAGEAITGSGALTETTTGTLAAVGTFTAGPEAITGDGALLETVVDTLAAVGVFTAAPSGAGLASPGYIVRAVVHGGRRATEVLSNPGFSSKDPSERLRVGFDFSALCDTISATTVVATRHAGTADDAPEAVLDGSPSASVAWALQWVTGGIDGTDYALRAEASSPEGEVFVLAGVLPVRAA